MSTSVEMAGRSLAEPRLGSPLVRRSVEGRTLTDSVGKDTSANLRRPSLRRIDRLQREIAPRRQAFRPEKQSTILAVGRESRGAWRSEGGGEGGVAGGRLVSNQLDRVADANRAHAEDGAVERHAAADLVYDPLAHTEILCLRVGIVGRHHAAAA